MALAILVAANPTTQLAAQEIDSVHISRPAPTTWQASYYLSAPASVIEFERPAAFFRERVWSVTTPGFRLTRRGDREIAIADSGTAPVRRIDFTFPTFAEPLPKEYEAFIRFSDGGVALYTGHFSARVPTGSNSDEAPFGAPLIVVPGAGRHGVVAGRVVDGPVTWSERGGNGTYIYLGPATPLATGAVLAIVDPGMPTWLEALAATRIPELFASYTTAFGLTLPWKPTVLYAFGDTTASGLNSGGGTLEGLVTLTLSGAGWKEESPTAREQAFQLLAHESFHFWNGQLAGTDPTPSGAWIHEGSADAMAEISALRFGIVDSARARATQQTKINRCIAAMAKGPTPTALGRGQIRQVYDCGYLMALWSGLAVREGDRADSLIGFWRRLLNEAVADGQGYDQRRYFATLRAMGVSEHTVESMRAFVGDSPDVGVAIASLRAMGAGIREVAVPPDAADQVGYAMDVFAHLMANACNRISFSYAVPIRTDGVRGCIPFSDRMAVGEIEGLAIESEGARIHDLVREACANSRAVRLGTTDGREVQAPCSRPLPARPSWYIVDRLILP